MNLDSLPKHRHRLASERAYDELRIDRGLAASGQPTRRSVGSREPPQPPPPCLKDAGDAEDRDHLSVAQPCGRRAIGHPLGDPVAAGSGEGRRILEPLRGRRCCDDFADDRIRTQGDAAGAGIYAQADANPADVKPLAVCESFSKETHLSGISRDSQRIKACPQGLLRVG